jgi:hypothetical protein
VERLLICELFSAQKFKAVSMLVWKLQSSPAALQGGGVLLPAWQKLQVSRSQFVLELVTAAISESVAGLKASSKLALEVESTLVNVATGVFVKAIEVSANNSTSFVVTFIVSFDFIIIF